MDKQRLQKLLIDYSVNEIQDKDYHELMDFVMLSGDDADLYVFMEKVWNSRTVDQPFSDLQSGLLYRRIVEDSRFKAPPIQKKARPVKLWKMIAAAAVLLIILSVGLMSYFNRAAFWNAVQSGFVAYDVKPGGNNAILTLANGRKIVLNNAATGKIAEEAGIIIEKSADGQLVYALSADTRGNNKTGGYNIVETPRGGQYQVHLPDGTKVWLNAASSLKFPSSFEGKPNRIVELNGEGYFEVAKILVNTEREKEMHKVPFIVKTNNQEIKVLGTHFNISNYVDEAEHKTTLLEGAVSVSTWDGTRNIASAEEVVLKPGQQALLASGRLNVRNVDVAAEAAWRNGYFVFKDEPMGSIMRKIARWYNVEIVFSGDMESRRFEGSISRFKNVSEVLRKFELTGGIHFKIEERRITVMP